MHEASIAEALLGQVCALVPTDARLLGVRVEVGELEHIDPGVLGAAWAGLTADGEYAGAKLEVVGVPLRIRCGACREESHPEDPAILLCAACGAVRPEVIEGSGILLRSLEVEEE